MFLEHKAGHWWSRRMHLSANRLQMAEKMDIGHLPFNLVQETAIDQYDQEALHWHINGQKSSSHCFQLLFRNNAFPRRHGHGQPCDVALCHCRGRVTCVDREIFATCPALHLTNICHKVQCTFHGFCIGLQKFVTR